ncbi:MAG: GNAT family N-acetyltransferase [Geminicoccaceae bacterium]
MSSAGIRLRPASPEDLAWLAALEQKPDYARFLCAWPADRHAASLIDPHKRYLVFEDSAANRCGFAILAGVGRRGRAIELVRIAVDRPGQGRGTAALRHLIGYVFDELGAMRLELDVFDDNERARRAYRGLGFREEQVLHDAGRRQDGTLGNLVIMGMAAGERPRAD